MLVTSTRLPFTYHLLMTLALATWSKPGSGKSIICNELDEHLLSDILGPAYNSRYMSIRSPVEKYAIDEDEGEKVSAWHFKRKVAYHGTFYVDDDYVREIADAPAWTVDHVHIANNEEMAKNASDRRRRRRRQLSTGVSGQRSRGQARQWECDSRIVWLDLGLHYFPRYLRSVECTATSCWYGHYKCKPRSFTVKLLRRKDDRCTVAKAGGLVGVHGLPEDLRQLWVWEERAVNFCCDCTH